MNLSFYAPPPWPADEEARQVLATRAVTRAPDIRDQLQGIVQAAATHYRTPIAAVSIIDDERQWFAASVGLDIGETPRATSFCGHTMLTPAAPLVVPDTLADARFAGNPNVLFAPHIRFYAGAPLVDAGGDAIGALCVIDRSARLAGDDYAELGRLAAVATALLLA